MTVHQVEETTLQQMLANLVIAKNDAAKKATIAAADGRVRKFALTSRKTAKTIDERENDSRKDERTSKERRRDGNDWSEESKR